MVVAACLTLAGCTSAPEPAEPVDPTAAAGSAPAVGAETADAGAGAGPPNVVLVVMDDFSVDLLPTMRSAAAMAQRGASYRYAFAVDSMCCVARASLLTGQYPHQTGVLTNISGSTGLGGNPAYVGHGNAERAVAVALQEAGWRTGFIGKYLNEYEWNPGWAVPDLPPGWTQFQALFGSAYDGWDFGRTHVRGGELGIVEHPAPPASASEEEKDRAYAGTVTAGLALRFVRRGERSGRPYFLQVAPYAPHSRVNREPHYPGDRLFPAAFADRPAPGREGNCGALACDELGLGDLPGHGDDVSDNVPLTLDGEPARAWNTHGNDVGARANVAELRDRAMMAQSVDRMVLDILDAVGPDTYVVLTSDNGFHLGQVGMARGKGTAYDTDIRVPLLVVGPGVAPGERQQVTSSIDLAATFLELAGLEPEPFRAGRSLVPTFADPDLVTTDHAFFEHTQQTLSTGDPDAAFAGAELDRIPTYTAVRSRDALLVRLDLDPSAEGVEHAYEFYSYAVDDFERTNRFADPAYAEQVADLMGRLERFDGCTSVTGDEAWPRRCRALTAAAAAG
jgi:arylsulfatase A-like enzyme